ncbi:MAG: hypothetical protein P8Y20_07200 [Gammaproteobacteria bacterium]
MDNALKKRLIGAAVLASLGVIFIPMLLEEDTVIDSDIYSSNIPEKQITSFEKPLVTDQEISEFKEQVEFGSSIKPQEGSEVKEIKNQADLEEKIEKKEISKKFFLSTRVIRYP